jgi:prevent-host-death family protein
MKLSEAKAKLSEVVEDVHSTHEEVEITRNGEPVAVIIAHDRLQSLRDTMELLADPAVQAQLREHSGDAEPASREELLDEIHRSARSKAVGE